ncbi:Cell cycle checkpoint protein rad17 [Haplosporangium bisporale]|nr:Cell cycle checkpoint protein rad17 [Haplosporangium bisporale]
MPPKGKSSAASIPRRNAPARSAKTRSAANTASMYKEAQEYVEQTLEGFSDEISDPEDIEDDSEDVDVVMDSFDEEETRPQKSPKRAPVKKRIAAKATGRSTKSSTAGSSTKGKGKETIKGTQGTNRPPTTKDRVLLGSKPEPEKLTPMKRKISETKFVLGRSSSVPTTPSAASPVIPRSQLQNRVASQNRRGPAGTGKTAVLRMLAQEMDLDIVEWINSVNENNLIRRAGLPDQKKWDSVDDARTFMTKAIKTLVAAEFIRNESYAPTTEEIQQLIEVHDGDIRAVINSLQFLCYLPLETRENYRVAARKLEEDNYVDSELKAQQGQDSSLDLFHAVGKVLFNKRDWRTLMEYDPDFVKIPPQATAQRKHRPSLYFNPEKNFAQMAQMEPYMTSLAVRGVLFAPMQQGPSQGGPPADFVGDDAKGLSSGHICGPGSLPKAVVREEVVPMLSKCVAMNPYLPIFQRVRPSSKSFIRNTVGVYGRGFGASAKEFGEGDEGFLEEIADQNDDGETIGSQGPSGSGIGRQAGQPQTPRTPNSAFSSSPSSWMSKKATPPSKLGSTHYQIPEDEDPIEEFSD